MTASTRGPILIGGTGRSGTTALARSLGLHPSINVLRWEAQFLSSPDGLLNLARRGFPVEDTEAFVSNMTGRWFRRVVREGTEKEYEAGLCADINEDAVQRANAYLTAAVADGGRSSPDIVAEYCATLLASLTGPDGEATMWGEKTPRNVLFVDELWKVFPDMRFFNVIRDGRDVAISMAHNGFWPVAAGDEFPELRRYRGPIDLALAMDYWADVLSLARKTAAVVPPNCYMEIRFEELAMDPANELQRVCAFIGVPYDPRISQFDFRPRTVDRWRKQLDAQTRQALTNRHAEALMAEGYRLT